MTWSLVRYLNGRSGKESFILHCFQVCLNINNLYLYLSSGASGIGAGMDIVVSSVKAYIGALNKMLGFKERFPQEIPPESAERTPVSA